MKINKLLIGLFVAAFLTCCHGLDGSDGADLPSTSNITSSDRDAKFISLFTVVRFENTGCYGSNSYNGTCLTSAECSSQGGTAAGTCASGFGVCCTFIFSSCDKTANRNCTYWQNPGGASGTYNQVGQCNFYIKKCSSNICQIRLDFLSFTLAQPEQTDGACTEDIFTVVSGASNPVPIICGDNTGQHMYLDMTPNTDIFELSIITSSTSLARSWNIKATQLPCCSTNLAPDQCLQYFTGTTGTIQSFNFKYIPLPTGTTTIRQLANQDYAICIRMNSGFCGICYSVCPDTLNAANAIVNGGFTISGDATMAGASVVDPQMCPDFLQIPCANSQRGSSIAQAAAAGITNCVDRICGTAFASYGAAATPMPVYSYRKPFELRFYTGSSETLPAPADVANLGFCLTYTQQPCI